MARVTVEDCIDKVESPYELVLVAKERASQLTAGIEPTIDRDNDKNTVITLRDIAETTLRQVVGSRNIDDILTTEKEAVQQEVLTKMREINAAYKTGIDVQQVLLQNVNPPAEVQDAFEDVVRAREDRDRIINLAEAYQAEQIPLAQGKAARVVEAAEAYKEGRLQIAQGEAAGFEELLKAYSLSKDVTRTRLYLDAIDNILPRVKKYIISDSASALPLLQLDGKSGGIE